MLTSPALTPFLYALGRVEAMDAEGVKITQPRLVPVFQIFGFGNIASMNPQINGRQSGILEKLQILKPVKPSLKNPSTFHAATSGKLLNKAEPQFSSFYAIGIM